MCGKIQSDGTLHQQIRVLYGNVDYSLKLKPQKIMELCQDIAVLHSDEAGYNLKYFRESHSGWALTGWHAFFTKRPSEGDTFELVTWTKPYKRVQADRNFLGIDKNGNELFRVASRWFLLDTEKRRPMRFKKEFFDSYVPSERDNVIPDEDYKHPSLDAYTLTSKREFIVTRRSIDANGHTNNISYIEWALDEIPAEIYNSSDISELRAEYSREALENTAVKSQCFTCEKDNGITEISSVFSDAISDEKLCRITTVWKKNI